MRNPLPQFRVAAVKRVSDTLEIHDKAFGDEKPHLHYAPKFGGFIPFVVLILSELGLFGVKVALQHAPQVAKHQLNVAYRRHV
jgi:hypothetical protein